MFTSKKSLSALVIDIYLLISTIFNFPLFADENSGNALPDPNMVICLSESELISTSLPFAPNNYRFLIYVPNPDGQEDSIRAAMKIILGRDLTPSEIRTSATGNQVEPNDLATHDILIVGWNADGNTAGLHSDDLAAGTTGRVILTGHDLDYHTVNGFEAAQTMLIQSINYVLEGGGTGMIILVDNVDAFSYLPKQAWGINAATGGTNTVTAFTSEGLATAPMIT
jgi:hypothetical protein